MKINEFERFNQYNRRQTLRKAALAAVVVPVILILFGGALASVIYLAVSRTGTDGITAGTFVSYLTALLMLMPPLNDWQRSMKKYRWESLRRIVFSLL